MMPTGYVDFCFRSSFRMPFLEPERALASTIVAAGKDYILDAGIRALAERN